MLPATVQVVAQVPCTEGVRSLTGDHTNPSKNVALNRARQLSPDEAYSAGYRQALTYGTMRGSLSSNPNYLAGWALGYKARQAKPAVGG